MSLILTLFQFAPFSISVQQRTRNFSLSRSCARRKSKKGRNMLKRQKWVETSKIITRKLNEQKSKWSEAIATLYWQMLDDVSLLVDDVGDLEWLKHVSYSRWIVAVSFVFARNSYIYWVFVRFLFQSFFFSWIKRTVNKWLLQTKCSFHLSLRMSFFFYIVHWVLSNTFVMPVKAVEKSNSPTKHSNALHHFKWEKIIWLLSNLLFCVVSFHLKHWNTHIQRQRERQKKIKNFRYQSFFGYYGAVGFEAIFQCAAIEFHSKTHQNQMNKKNQHPCCNHLRL